MRCAFGNCKREAKYFMTWNNGTGKVSGLVCATHDKRLGRHHLMELVGMTLEEAIEFETMLKRTVNDE